MNITGADAARLRPGLPGLNCRRALGGAPPDARIGNGSAGPAANGAWRIRAAANRWKAVFPMKPRWFRWWWFWLLIPTADRRGAAAFRRRSSRSLARHTPGGGRVESLSTTFFQRARTDRHDPGAKRGGGGRSGPGHGRAIARAEQSGGRSGLAAAVAGTSGANGELIAYLWLNQPPDIFQSWAAHTGRNQSSRPLGIRHSRQAGHDFVTHRIGAVEL
jgi:hypothetical protein